MQLQTIIDAWCSISPRMLLRLALLLALYDLIIVIPILPGQRAGIQWGPLFNGFLALQLKGFAVMLGVVIADRAADARRSALWPYAIAVFVGVVVGAMLLWVITQRLIGSPTVVTLRTGAPYEPFVDFTVRHTSGALLIFGLGTAVYLARRRARLRLERLLFVQLRRTQLDQQVLDSRMAAMRARIEPAFVVQSLSAIERQYERDPPAGERALMELARHLRSILSPLPAAAAAGAIQRDTSS